jgi:signal transduction histidine kinase/DNA-binding response OmpR family regulator
MKLNVRFILTTFITVLIISFSSTFVFYFLANRVLVQQQSKSLINSTTAFAFNFQSELQKTDEDFGTLIPQTKNFSSISLNSTQIDFLFTLVNDTLINAKEFKIKSSAYLNIRTSSFQKFFMENPTLILRYSQLKDGKTYYYGRTISSEVLNRLGEKINADVALLVNEAPVEISNPEQNQSSLRSLVNASRDLKFKNNFDLYSESLSDRDFLSSLYNPKFTLFPAGKVSFIVFQSFKEGLEFRDTLRIVMLLIIVAGSALTFIIVLVSTMKLRKQITLLSIAAIETSRGNLDHRVSIITQDEIGHFGEAFNKMLEELVRNKNAEKEYSEFIALINKNPTLIEIADAALAKIIKSTHLTFGALYLVQNKTLRLISSVGIGKNISNPSQDSELYLDVMNKNEMAEFVFKENYPEINAGIATIKIQYLLIYPVIFNRETIAILELASESEPKGDIKNYINSINEQLAIGLVNAKSFEQLENLVGELRILNEEYQKQNEQIIEQNEELKQLHTQLREKAEELEHQKERAIELTKVKSEFLASMSHELRTPLISILGLTELLLKDLGVEVKVKDRLKIVDRNGRKLLALINNILEFSKFDSGKIDVKKETFMLGEFIEEVYPTIHQLTSEKELLLVIDLPKNKNILLNTDKVKLEQVILNLIVNAVKFTENGFVKLKAAMNNISGINISVEDSGIGISEANQKIIFDEFKQVDGSTSRKYSGAGLGLAICKKYSEILGGKLTLKSELGQGSEFMLCLPDSVLDIIDISQHEFLTVKNTKEILEQKTQDCVLLVNDNPAARQLISDYLSSYHLKVEVVENSLAARSFIDEKKYKAIVLNPMDNAWQLSLQICQTKNNSQTPIIFTLILDDKKIGWEPDIFGFLVQPVSSNALSSHFSNARKINKQKIETVAIVGSITDSISKLKEDIQNIHDVSVVYIAKDLKEFLSLPNINKVDHVLIELNSMKESALEVCYGVSINRALRNKLITFILPDEISPELNEKLNTRFKEIALKVKLHPLDILKYLRDRLQIGEKTINNKIKLIVEPSEEIQHSVQLQKNINSLPMVLIVDDDNDALFTISEYVKNLQCDTIFAHNGMECLLTLNHVQPNIILLDIMMPKMDGFETIKRIREDERFAKLPVIALTAYAMLDNKSVVEKNGFDDLITKPINSQILSAKLSKYINVKATL